MTVIYKQNSFPDCAAGWSYAASKGLRKSSKDEHHCVNENQDAKNINMFCCSFLISCI